jgi:membrane-associated phospholipid phosphatase
MFTLGMPKPTLFLGFLVAVAASCVNPQPSRATQSQSADVQWRPIVLTSAGEIPVPAPPAAKSAQVTLESSELRTLQTKRSAQTKVTANYWNLGAVVRWNEIARDLVIQHKTNPPMASRVYALLSVAQYDALVAATYSSRKYNRRLPDPAQSGVTPLVAPSSDLAYPADHAVVAGASAAVLAYLYPDQADFLAAKAKEDEESRLWAGVNFRSDIVAGDTLGREVAARVIAQARTDGSDAVWTGTVPTGKGIWFSILNPPVPPLLPLWGKVRPWLMKSGDQFRPPPPPAFGSPEFEAALNEVRQISDHRTPDQFRIALFWADGPGTYTPPGHWNAIAADLIVKRHRRELEAARILAFMNMALMDAGISCWDAKYVYWLIRPSEADPAITTAVALPNFPSYTSGHSAFSGAASEVLGYFFPDQLKALRGMAQEAAISRVYGGIHYRFDSDKGLEAGRAIARLAIERARAEH